MPRSARPWAYCRRPAYVLFALVVLDVAVYSARGVWDRHSPDDYAERVTGCAAAPRAVVFAGGSPVSEGIDPARAGGENAYAVGLPGGTTTDMYYAVKLACPTPPRVLVYGCTASDLNDARNEPHGVASLMTAADVRELAAVRPDAAVWAARQYGFATLNRAWGVYRFRHGVRMAAASGAGDWCPEAAREARELSAYSAALRVGTGYAPAAGFADQRYDAVKAAGMKTAPFTYLNKYRTGSHARYAAKLAEWCRAGGTELILVDMPVAADLEAEYPGPFAEYRRLLRDWEAAGFTIWRADRAALGLTDAAFADAIHLNRAGAGALSDWLRNKLESRSNAPPAVARAQAGGGP